MGDIYTGNLTIISEFSDSKRIDLAYSILMNGDGGVIIDNTIIINYKELMLNFEVIHKSGNDVIQEMQDSKLLLEKSSIWIRIKDLKQCWVVVDITHMGRVPIWPIK